MRRACSRYLESLPIQQRNLDLEPLTLSEFIIQGWSVLEPATDYLHNWHIDAVSDALTAVTKKQIKKLVIEVPPGAMKSMLACVFWPAWEWAEISPVTRWLYSSYEAGLATRDSVKCRRLIQSDWYQQRYGHKFALLPDQNVKTNFENDRTGFRKATSVGGGGTGNRADRIVVDDPHKVTEAESASIRESTVEWWATEMSNRGSSKESAYLVIQQRVHCDDVAGWCLEHGYEHLIIPHEYEGVKYFGCLGLEDPRDKEGELYWPDRFDADWVASQKIALGSYGYAGQHQQRPVPREGGMIKLAWFQRYRQLPANPDAIIQSWDTASKAKELNCPSVCGTWFVKGGNYYLADVFRKRMEYPELRRTAGNLAIKWKPTQILVEDKSTGQSLLQDMKLGVDDSGRKEYFNLIPIEPEGDKITRISTESPAIEAGRVFLPESAPWLPDYELELTTCPNSSLFDQVDMTSQFLKRVREGAVSAFDYY